MSGASLHSPATAPSTLLVACLCANWCGTCRDYRTLFAQLQNEFPALEFRWIDIEDEADLVDPVDVEDFPTLLIANGKQAKFFGPVLPHIETLRRLLQSHVSRDQPALTDPAAHALAQRVTASR